VYPCYAAARRPNRGADSYLGIREAIRAQRRHRERVSRAVRKLRLSSCPILILVALIAAPAAHAANPIQTENAQPGDSYWTAATHDSVGPNPPIEGYANATSVRPGGTLELQVSARPAARYRIEISRLGWYGGTGGRRITCLVGSKLDPTCSRDRLGLGQPSASAPDPVTGEIRAGWSTTDTLNVPTSWTTGYYLAVFRLTSGPSTGQSGFTPFIVQAPVGDRAAILVQVPANTWQAYNTWGGRDLYTTPRAVKVSFDRPYAHRLLFNWEYPLVRFLERGGWDVSYATDDDVDADPSILLDHALDMTAGHDEYWTKTMRDGWEAARAAGVNLAFLGANTGYWQVRYEDSRRTVVGYKYSPDPDPDPTDKTTEFRALQSPRPECQLMGVQFNGVVLPNQYLDYVAGSVVTADPWFAGTGLTSGSVLTGLGGYETDSITRGCHVPPVTPLLSYSGSPLASDGSPTRADAVRYTACSGAEVFSAGSLQFSWGLDSWRDPSYADPALPPVPPASPGLQQAMTQALGDLTRSHVPMPAPPQICVPTATFAPSISQAVVGQPVVFNSTAADPYGQISSQAWDLSGTGRFADATGPAATWTFPTPGLVHVGLRVTDASGANSTTDQALWVCVCPAPGQPGPSALPAGAQVGNACQQVSIGSVRVVGRRLWFEPDSGITSFSIRTYRITLRSGRIRLMRLGARVTAHATTLLPIRNVRAPVLIDITSQTGGRFQHQQFLLPYRRGHTLAPPGSLTATACDGTSARVLTPSFGGPRSLPLRVAVMGQGRLTVTLVPPGATALHRRVVTGRGGAVVIAFAARRLPPGVYHITVSAQHPQLPGPLALTALGL
jgi:hypothetical protein